MAPMQSQVGHEEPFAIQFSVFLANRVGKLRDLLVSLAKAGIGLYGFTIIDSSEWAVVRMICSDPAKARELLQAEGLGYTEKAVILAELPADDSMADICSLLIRAEINIAFAYPLQIRSHQRPVMVLRTDEHTLAVHLLVRNGYTLLGAEDLADPR
jgi:hypothetical protein